MARKRQEKAEPAFRPLDWETRFAQLKKFISLHGRLPDRHCPRVKGESSLAWWVKDQRRRIRIGASNIAKRGAITEKQRDRLIALGVFPDPRRGLPFADQHLETAIRSAIGG